MSKRNEMAERLAPGIWKDQNGAVHINIPELMALFELEDTPENHARCRDIAEKVIRGQFPQAMVFHRAKETDSASRHDAN